MTAPVPLGKAAAKDRTVVVLPDGRYGRLLWVDPYTRKAKVRSGGRHLRVHADELRRAS